MQNTDDNNLEKMLIFPLSSAESVYTVGNNGSRRQTKCDQNRSHWYGIIVGTPVGVTVVGGGRDHYRPQHPEIGL